MEELYNRVLDILTADIVLGPIDFPFSLFELIFEFGLPVLAFFIGFKLVLRGMRKLLSRGRLETNVQGRIYWWIKLVIRLIFIVVIGIFAGRIFGAEMQKYGSRIGEILTQPIFESGSTKISIITLILLIPIFYIAGWLSKLARRFVNKSLMHTISIDDGKRSSIGNLVRYGTLVLVLVIGLSIIGINLSALAVLFGVLGIGLGFGLQDVVANFFAGLVIIFSRPIKEGDRILVDNLDGDVVEIRTLSSIINTVTNETIVMPNSHITKNPVHNYSFSDSRIVLINAIQVAYESDIERVLKVMEEVGYRSPYLTPEKRVKARVSEFADSGIECKLLIWIDNATDKFEAYWWNNLELWRAFRDNGITIPFPQVDLHIKKN
ncbi:MAG: mechanosensitive ion channel [Spirochaetales bacterium]|nr:mechanosensitive ion channel [Spirochaetales bacterium]MCF7937831.1 mechanosensitive ion channel [Spirochaetales bacterium]